MNIKQYKKIWLWILLWITLINLSFADNWNLPWVTIISRSERWADESIRLYYGKDSSTSNPKVQTWTQTESQKKSAEISKIRNEWMAKNYPNERKYEWSRTTSWAFTLVVPEYYNHHKNKIIIHHTATNYDPNRTIDDIKASIRQMYRYHTLNRKFGDIWYNFLIDQLWNIYEWHSWWEWVVWAHASSNNITSIWIALMWNFENEKPTKSQVAALVNLTTALSKFYNIDPLWYSYTFSTNTRKEPYVTATKNPSIMWHWDTKATACPGDNLYTLLPLIRKEVDYRIKHWIIWDSPLPTSWSSMLKTDNYTNKQEDKATIKTTSNTKKDFSKQLISLLEKDPSIFTKAAKKVQDNYKWTLHKATNSITKISKKYSKSDINTLINQDISVLLYELTTQYDSFEIKCDMSCIFNIDGVNYNRTWADITFLSNQIKINSKHSLTANSISVKSSLSNWSVKINNYNRKSYAGIPRNIFKWTLNFEKWSYPLLNWEQKSDFIVTNTLPFKEYMKWIVETNDTETLEKNKVMSLISKNYALFYLNKENIHPSIPLNAKYSAIDDPNFFQKYVWAWLENTLKKRYQALNDTENEIIMYDNYMPILPYFNCSPWFTLSAKDKRWRTDTPYLQSTYDWVTCNDFIWHGVWLSGKWAERLAEQWLTYDQILKYYYNWINIVTIK